MDRLTRWETEALRRRGGRPRPRSGTVDLRDRVTRSPDPRPTSGAPATADQPTGDTPPGTLLVPLDAWQRMLDQLGNLHQAGQQLAEASARAARAETEAEFLRERVADLRRELADASEDRNTRSEDARSDDPRSDPEAGPPDTSVGLTSMALTRARSVYRRLRSRRRPHPRG